MIWFFLVALLAGLAGVALLLSSDGAAPPQVRRRFDRVLKAEDDTPFNHQRLKRASLLARTRQLVARVPGSDLEQIEIALRQAGWIEPGRRMVALASLWLAPVVAALLGLGLGLAFSDRPLAIAFVAFVAGFLAPRHFLRWRAAQRQAAIREEMPTVLHLMRMLFDAGLSLEHTLKAISEQGRAITPHLATEFGAALQRISNGQERGEALDEMARQVGVAELRETTAILKQVTRHGGSLRDSLLNYLRLIEDRRMTDLREQVSKLSAKMTIVSVVFLFPALLIFLAAPGLLALTRALVNM